MLQLKNSTPFPAAFWLLPDPEGIDSIYTVIKATFTIDDDVVLAEEQAPIVLASEFYGEPNASSIRLPSDFSLIKPATDVLMIGTAYAPNGRSTAEMDVSFSV